MTSLLFSIVGRDYYLKDGIEKNRKMTYFREDKTGRVYSSY